MIRTEVMIARTMRRGALSVLVCAFVIGCGRDVDAPAGPVPSVDASLIEATGGTTPPSPPVVFLHYDYMAAPEWDPSRGNFAPDPAAIQRVVDAYRDHGITLVIDPQHTEIPYHNFLFFAPRGFRFIYRDGYPCGPPVCVNFYELRDQYFQPNGRQAWHYVIFGDLGLDQGGQRLGGQAELPGYNFFVTVLEPRRQCFRGTNVDFCRERVSSMFMHELGHNLGLDHGGDEPANYKPNYLSVMNYLFLTGIMFTAPGDTAQFRTWLGSPPEFLTEYQRIAGIRLGYSDDVLPTLDELHLDERIGIGGRAGRRDVTSYLSCAPLRPCYNGFARVAAGPLDWDNDGVITADVAADINNYEGAYSTFEFDFSPQRGYDDWAHVHQFLRTPQYAAGTLRPVQLIADPSGSGNSQLPVR